MTEERLQEIERKLSRDVVMRCNGETGIWTSEGAEPVSHEDIRALIAEVRRLRPITSIGPSPRIVKAVEDWERKHLAEGSEPNPDHTPF